MKKLRTLLLPAMAFILLSSVAQALEKSGPRLSEEGIEKIQTMLNEEIKNQNIPGYVALVSYKSRYYLIPGGNTDYTSGIPMSADKIFRISSMSKPITVVAALKLIEQGQMDLNDPIEKWIPEFANLEVLKTLESQINETVPLKTPVTVRHLLNNTFGTGMIMQEGDFPIEEALQRRGLQVGPPAPQDKLSGQELISCLTELPLMAQPGERWLYHRSMEVLSGLIPRVSGKSLSEYLQEEIFAPLKMEDTAFVVPPQKLERLTPSFVVNPDKGKKILYDYPKDSQWASPPPFESGADGLVSTVEDYYRFTKMLLQEGTYQGRRVLEKSWVREMTQNQLTPEQLETFDSDGTHGFGYGLLVTLESGLPGDNIGQFGWAGGLGTYWFADPQTGLIGILMTPMAQESPQVPKRVLEFNRLVYEALQ